MRLTKILRRGEASTNFCTKVLRAKLHIHTQIFPTKREMW